MIIQTLKSDTSYIKATITGLIVIDSIDKNKIVLKNIKGSQILSSSSGEVVTIKYDQKLLANIIKNDEI